MKTPIIGFIGQGFIGKNYADDFEKRGYTVVRYSKEEAYQGNREAVGKCDIVFVAVPTPTTPTGYDSSILRDALGATTSGSVVVVKSTILPGLTLELQSLFPDRIIMHSPEFLSEATAAHDAANPFMNIVGITRDTPEHRAAAELVHSVLPKAPYTATVSSTEAELIKYTHNCSGYTQIIFFNLMYDLAHSLGADWTQIESAIKADPFVPHRYASPVHKSGRGAGGHCFIKDFAALREVFARQVGDETGLSVLHNMEEKNKELLVSTGKDLDLLAGVYGKREG